MTEGLPGKFVLFSGIVISGMVQPEILQEDAI